MRFQKICAALICWSVFLVLTNETYGFLDTPPELDAYAERDGDTVIVSGTVVDEDPSTVAISVQIGTSPPILVPVFIVDGKFSFEIAVPLEIDSIAVSATNQFGTDTQVVDIAFEPSSRVVD